MYAAADWIGSLLRYARAVQVEWRLGLLLGLGLAAGGYFGAQWAQVLPMGVVKMFAAVLVICGDAMLFSR